MCFPLLSISILFGCCIDGRLVPRPMVPRHEIVHQTGIIQTYNIVINACHSTLTVASFLLPLQAALNRPSTLCVGNACSNRITSSTPNNACCSLGTSKYSPHMVIPISASINTGAESRLLRAVAQSRRTIARILSNVARWCTAEPGPSGGQVGSKTSRRRREIGRAHV